MKKTISIVHCTRLDARMVIVLSTFLTIGSLGCQTQHAMEEANVIAWASKFGMEIDNGYVGQWPPANISVEEWDAQGRALPHAEQILLDMLQKNDKRLHRALTVQALCAVGTVNAIPQVIQIAKDDQDDDMRHVAIWVLGEIGSGNEEVMHALFLCMMYDNYRDNRTTAALSLAKVADASGIGMFEAALERIDSERWYLQSGLTQLRERLKTHE
jgi:hypothetical protein